MLEFFHLSTGYEKCINSIFADSTDRELSKIPIVVKRIQGTKIYNQYGDDTTETELDQHTILIEEKKSDVIKMDLFSIREEIYKKAYKSVTVKKKKLFETIQQTQTTLSINDSNMVEQYINVLKLLRENPNLTLMMNPVLYEKLIKNIFHDQQNKMKVRKYLAELEDV